MARDTNFYYSFLVLPAEKRRAIIAVWDFCRAVDDAVDNARAKAPREMMRRDRRSRAGAPSWRGPSARCSGDGTGSRARSVVRRFNIARQPFESLIEGVEMDLGGAPLCDLCGTLRVLHPGRVVRGRLDVSRYLRRARPAGAAYAIELGVALQLPISCVMFPKIFAAAGSTFRSRICRRTAVVKTICDRSWCAGSGVRSAAVKAVLRQQGERARDYYRRAAASLPRADVRRLAAAEIMAAIYRAILRRIERKDL